ncbi:unnamed protein product [Cutaneotrichosporon oleaginosum]
MTIVNNRVKGGSGSGKKKSAASALACPRGIARMQQRGGARREVSLFNGEEKPTSMHSALAAKASTESATAWLHVTATDHILIRGRIILMSVLRLLEGGCGRTWTPREDEALPPARLASRPKLTLPAPSRSRRCALPHTLLSRLDVDLDAAVAEKRARELFARDSRIPVPAFGHDEEGYGGKAKEAEHEEDVGAFAGLGRHGRGWDAEMDVKEKRSARQREVAEVEVRP